MDITKMSDTELKALAFDETQKRDVAAQNVELIMQELAKRREEAANLPAPKPPKK